MVRSEIISKLSQRIHRKLKKSDLDKILQVIVNTIVDGIIDNRSTELRGFGRFSVKKLNEKISRNPKTGDKIYSPKKKSISFKMSKELKKKININGLEN
tara:strand:- start:1238 stop:1534 length:297 start_codon:yes stop_codon:yes gene_type:complete